MHRRPVLFLLLGLLTSIASAHPPGEREVRGVWITTAAGLDWPHSLDPREQSRSLREMVRHLQQSNFNTIFFQARARGDAYYRSSHEPWAENLTGTLGKNPGWDPLQFLLDEAHAAGMEVHAWFNVYKVRSPGRASETRPLHPSIAFDRYLVEVDQEGWLDPGALPVRQYTLKVAIDLISRYDVDGIMFDFLRYPSRDFPDDDTYRMLGNGMKRDDWRRLNIDRFVTEFHDGATRIKPLLKIGSAPIGIYDGDPDGDALGAYHSYYQDSQGWLKSGKHDYLVPQIYWDIGSSKGDPDFARLVERWQKGAYGRHVYAGIAAYKPEVLDELPLEIDVSRRSGTKGQVFFRYEHILDQRFFERRYAHPALVPPMTWKDSVAPSRPRNLAVTELSPTAFMLEWSPVDAGRPEDEARRIAIYRRLPAGQAGSAGHDGDRSRSLVAVIGSDVNHYIDSVRTPASLRYTYHVTALDRMSNESAASDSASAVVREGLDLGRRVASVSGLSLSIPRNPLLPSLVAYRLASRTALTLVVREAETDDHVTTLAEGDQEAGTYIVGLPSHRFRPGRYLVRLKVPNQTYEQVLVIPSSSL